MCNSRMLKCRMRCSCWGLCCAACNSSILIFIRCKFPDPVNPLAKSPTNSHWTPLHHPHRPTRLWPPQSYESCDSGRFFAEILRGLPKVLKVMKVLKVLRPMGRFAPCPKHPNASPWRPIAIPSPMGSQRFLPSRFVSGEVSTWAKAMPATYTKHHQASPSILLQTNASMVKHALDLTQGICC